MIREIATLSVALILLGCSSEKQRNSVDEQCNFYGRTFCIMSTAYGVHITGGTDEFSLYTFFVGDVRSIQIVEADNSPVTKLEGFVERQVGQTTVKFESSTERNMIWRRYLNESRKNLDLINIMSAIDMTDEEREFVERAEATLRYCEPAGASMICE